MRLRSEEYGPAQCFECTPGRFNSNVTATSCEPCGAGYFSRTNRSSTCEVCTDGFFAKATSATVCDGCARGRFSDGFFTAAVGNSKCVDCQPGRFASAARASACITAQTLRCSTGEALIQPANTTHDGVCQKCAPGFFQPDGSSIASSCFPCEDGYVPPCCSPQKWCAQSEVPSRSCRVWQVCRRSRHVHVQHLYAHTVQRELLPCRFKCNIGRSLSVVCTWIFSTRPQPKVSQIAWAGGANLILELLVRL